MASPKQDDCAEKRKKIKLCAARRDFVFSNGGKVVQRCVEVGVGQPTANTPIGSFQFIGNDSINFYGEFDSGSERTLAACLRHASRTGFIW